MTIPVTSRFSIHENPNVAPGICCMCGSSGGDGRTFVDFGFQLDVYGAVYFCSECVRELCGAIGYVPASELEAERKLSNDLSDKVELLEERNREVRESAYSLFRDCNCKLGSGSSVLFDSTKVSVSNSVEGTSKSDKTGSK